MWSAGLAPGARDPAFFLSYSAAKGWSWNDAAFPQNYYVLGQELIRLVYLLLTTITPGEGMALGPCACGFQCFTQRQTCTPNPAGQEGRKLTSSRRHTELGQEPDLGVREAAVTQPKLQLPSLPTACSMGTNGLMECQTERAV